MKTRLHLKPGQRGTKKLVNQYGDRLVCVRFRYDGKRKKRLKTVELIVEEIDWEPGRQKIAADAIVGIRVHWGEKELAKQVKAAGGVWDRDGQVWNLRYDRVAELGLEERLVREDDGIYI